MKKKRAAKRPLISWLWQSYNWSAAVPSIFHSSVPPFPTLIDKPLTCNAEQNQEFLLFFYWAPHHHFKWPFFFLPLHKRIICCLEFRFFATTKLSDPSHLKILNLNFQKIKAWNSTHSSIFSSLSSWSNSQFSLFETISNSFFFWPQKRGM